MVRRKASSVLIVFSMLMLIGFSITLVWVRWELSDLPFPQDITSRLNTPSVQITDRNGRLLYESLAENAGRHAVTSLADIPLVLQQATIATEDQSFYTNPGVDIRGILRALWINLRGGDTIAGGSTITQQLARTVLMDASERYQRSLQRKFRESYLAWQLTRHFTKDEILAFYLNQTYYGGFAYGVEAASQTFFGKSVKDLDLAEAALLAGLPQSPAAYNPFTDPQAASARQKVVLDLMLANRFITEEQHDLAVREKLIFAETPYPIEAPHFVMMVRQQIDQLFTPEEIYSNGGLIVQTTLDLNWQKLAEQAITQQLETLSNSVHGLGHNVNNAALVALDTHSGEILALVGSPDYFDQANAGAINMAISPRQPGSALKPLVYATALDPTQTAPWTPASLIWDVRTSFITHEGEAYTPANYDLKEHGPVLVRQALASSLNIPAVITLDHIGLKRLFDQAARMGITTLKDPDQYDLSLALGGGEVSLLELTGAYAVFANGGYQLTPVSILKITNPTGDVLYSSSPVAKARVLDERVSWLISDILSDNDARTLGFGPNSILRLDRPAAVKTGTTSNFHDNWTVGYTPDLVVGVWAGNTNYEPMREVNGLAGAAPIWHEFMRAVLTGQIPKSFIRPPGMVQVEICALSGLLPTPYCQYRRLEWFIAGTQPSKADNLYNTVTIDMQTGLLAGPSTPSNQRQTVIALDIPPQALPWARSQGITTTRVDNMTPANSIQTNSSQSLLLITPADGSRFQISPGFAAQAQQIRLEAVAQNNLQQVSIWVDGEPIDQPASQPYEAWWRLIPGQHTAWAQAVDSAGQLVRSPTVTFEVTP